jgi:nucleotide-binding universal stress UspA family protein
VQTRLYLRAGEPAGEIVRFAAEHESDLIVLAWHGSLAGERAATLKGVIRDAGCPLFIVQVQTA